MAWNNPQIPTRSSRNRRNKMNGLLIWAIGIVIVAILLVGGYLLYSVLAPSSQSTNGKVTSKTTAEKSASKKTTASAKNKKASSTSTDQSDQSTGTDGTASASDPTSADGSSDSDSTDTTSSTSDAYHFVGGGPNGPWQPIGTIQSEPHKTDYTKGSIDWNERIKALLYATNINDNDYILWRLQNGGSSDKSEGIISTKEDQNKKYDVIMKWVKNKGWQPLSVKVDSSDTTQSSPASDSTSAN